MLCRTLTLLVTTTQCCRMQNASKSLSKFCPRSRLAPSASRYTRLDYRVVLLTAHCCRALDMATWLVGWLVVWPVSAFGYGLSQLLILCHPHLVMVAPFKRNFVSCGLTDWQCVCVCVCHMAQIWTLAVNNRFVLCCLFGPVLSKTPIIWNELLAISQLLC